MSNLELLAEIDSLVDVETVTSYNINTILANIVEKVDLSDSEYESVLKYLWGDEHVKVDRDKSSC